MADVAGQIDAALGAAEAAESKAVTYTDRAITTSQGQATTGAGLTVVAPTVTPPPFDPSVPLADQYQTTFDAEWVGLETWMRASMADWMNTYFPTINQAMGAAVDSWMLNVLNNGYSGIPAALEQVIWDRARSKDSIEAVRLEEEALEQFSSRGFSMPPGVLAASVLKVQQDAANKSSTIARDLAIKQIETAIDMVKFSASEINKLRVGIAGALADYMRAWMSMPQLASDVAKTKAQMQQLLWDASANYMRSQVDIAKLSLDAQVANADNNVDLQRLTIEAFYRSIDNQVKAAVEAADTMGRSAAAARGAQNTLVGDILTTAATAAAA